MALFDKLKPTECKGVFYIEHPTRKRGIHKDRLLYVRFMIAGKTHLEEYGWTSEKNEAGEPYTPEGALQTIRRFKANHKAGTGPTCLTEEREARQKTERKQKEVERAAEEEAARLNVSVNTFFDTVYLPQAKQDKKPDTWGTEARLFRYWIAPVIGGLCFPDISIEHLNKIKANMASGKRAAVGKHPRDKTRDAGGDRNPARPLSPKTINYALAVVRQVWNLATAVKPPLASGPWPGQSRQLKKPKIDNMRRRFLSHEEAARLLDRLKQSSIDVHDMALLALHTGIRAGDIFGLQWQRVNLRKGEITLLDTKNGESRVVFLTDEALAMLRGRAVNREPGRHVFINSKGVSFTAMPVTFFRCVEEIGLNEGVTDPREKVVFHSLRHTHASWQIENGANIKLVADLLGHKTLAMTVRYSHTTQDAQREAVKRLSERLRPAGENVTHIGEAKKR